MPAIDLTRKSTRTATHDERLTSSWALYKRLRHARRRLRFTPSARFLKTQSPHPTAPPVQSARPDHAQSKSLHQGSVATPFPACYRHRSAMKIDPQTDRAPRTPAIAPPLCRHNIRAAKPNFLIANALLESSPTHSKQTVVTFSNRKWMAISEFDFFHAVSYLTRFRPRTSIVSLPLVNNFDRVTP
jgi:hypothetical protein